MYKFISTRFSMQQNIIITINYHFTNHVIVLHIQQLLYRFNIIKTIIYQSVL